jgi:hypothetical protein
MIHVAVTTIHNWESMLATSRNGFQYKILSLPWELLTGLGAHDSNQYRS